MIEKPLENEKVFLNNSLRGIPLRKSIHIVSLEAKMNEIKKAVASAKKSDVAIFFCLDAHLYKGCRRLLESLQKVTKKFVLVLMRDPYDASLARPSTTVVTAFGYRFCQLKACLKALFEI